MPDLLHIAASPRGDLSHSRRLADAFLAAYREAHPHDTIEELELWDLALPALDAEVLTAREALFSGKPASGAAHERWQEVEQFARQFKSAKKLLLSVPMWNFSVPYVLKHYMDLVMQPGISFHYSSKTGYRGLVDGREAIVIQASAGSYHDGSNWEPYDFLTPYLRFWLELMGYTEIHTIPLTHTGDPARSNESTVHAQLLDLAAETVAVTFP